MPVWMICTTQAEATTSENLEMAAIMLVLFALFITLVMMFHK